MRNVLIIGGSGFIGKNIIEVVLKEKTKVILLTRNEIGFKESFPLSNRVEIIIGTLGDAELIKSIVINKKVNVVIHLACGLIPSSTLTEFRKELSNIILPTLELIEYLSSLKVKIIYFSSGGAVYGNVEDEINEDHPLKPITFYGYSKLIIENHIQLLSRISGLNYIILRPSNAYGKFQRMEAKQGFIPVTIGKILSGEPITVWGDGQIVRDFVYARDLAELTMKIINSSITNKTYNVGSGKGSMILEIVKLMEHHFKKSIEIQWLKGRDFDVNKVVLNISRIKADFAFSPTSIEIGLKDYINLVTVNEK